MIADAEVVGTLCTGWVRTFDGRQVVVALEDEMVVARLAIPLYRPGPGDEVLLARQHHDAFVIGVLQIAGAAELFAPEGLRIRSVGALDLVSAQQTRISGPRVGIEASSLTVAARSVAERFGRAHRWVRDCFQLRAGRTRTEVSGACETQAGRIVQCAEGAVRIDGESIDLG